ncbi:ubiquitin carboxyl-terminal hydrolase 15 isoform X9 [Ursus americanus]|uniref:ubiquitin carboxyl-terminal hydrolase 15 isoform X6 n=1 Tax=Ailuropoda melanoleuca TaxID=9646 RepID=UPI001494492A|nr:ubiquitin carboxyl-terminal hydrolase 15 isoform X6 [Ailuropoda melanoleuca]XP_044240588.1 ubiquitin carboxyl-terminal hydrolase 15 isoform X7 [Ursus arctos]XP_045645654.1 ubiquitin carboxyl-terminal hydrolase 15 isoform X9 [Ursus americanus]
MAEGGAADLDIQRSDIATLLKTSLRKGDTWYLVDSRWFKQWKKYVGFDSWDKYQMGDQNVYPGPIDNSGLLKDGDAQSLKEHLIDELDYILLPTEGWNKLVSWYTLMEGQEPIARKVVEQGMFVKHCKVEVYLTELKLCENGNMNNVVTRRFSKADTIDTIEKEIRKIFNIPDEKETRLWNKYMSNTFEPLNKPDSTIQDAGLYQGQVLVIEQKNEDGTWPRGPSAPKFLLRTVVLTFRKTKVQAEHSESGQLVGVDLNTGPQVHPIFQLYQRSLLHLCQIIITTSTTEM